MEICSSFRAVGTGSDRIPAISMADSPVSFVIRRTPETLTLRHRHQSSSHHVHVYQAAGDEQSVGILAQTTVADLGEAEDLFQDEQRLLARGANTVSVTVPGPIFLVGRRVAVGLVLGKVFGPHDWNYRRPDRDR